MTRTKKALAWFARFILGADLSPANADSNVPSKLLRGELRFSRKTSAALLGVNVRAFQSRTKRTVGL